MRATSIQDVVRMGLCVSCGACVSEAPEGSMRMNLSGDGRQPLPEILEPEKVNGRGSEFDVCPGVGLPLESISRELYGEHIPTSPELGRYRLAVASHSTNPEVLQRASSGGVMTDIAHYLMEKGYVGGATVVEMGYGPAGPRPVARIARTWAELLAGQGSKYCPTSVNTLVQECVRQGGRYLFSGTPCQVGALRLAIRKHPGMAINFPFTMANFCGGFRDFRQTDWLITKHGLRPSEVRYFRYRGGGQPGSMVIRTADRRMATEPYPEYLNGCCIPKLKRCTFCIDGTGVLADFACGDAWLDRYMQHEASWSILMARSQQAEAIVRDMIGQGRLVAEDISAQEIIKSQWSNLSSKIFRQYKRMKLCRLLGMALPQWDVELPRGRSTYWREIRTLVRKRLSRFKVLVWVKRKITG